MQPDNDFLNEKFISTEDVVLELKPQKGYVFLRDFLLVMLISILIFLAPFIYFLIMGDTLTFYIGLAALAAVVLISALGFFVRLRRTKYIITNEDLQVISGNGTRIICPLKAIKIINEDKIRCRQPSVCNIIINAGSRKICGKPNRMYAMILGGADADTPENQGKIRLSGIRNPVEVCDVLCKNRKAESIENYKERSVNTEVIAKKAVHVFIIWIVLGIILIAFSVIILIGLIMDEFDIYFLLMSTGAGFFGFTALVMGVRNKKLPVDLIAANEEGFSILTTGELIPYHEVHSVATKYYNRMIIITERNGYKHVVWSVANYSEVKLIIAKKVKEKTGWDIVVL